ncbi:MAG TPA: bifunctional UDP-sugar hydrolase/5'-nucleotidase [Thermoanaerobaculia bacterium]
MRIRRAALLCVFALLAGPSPARAVTLTVLHTSDLHGHVHPTDEVVNRDFGEGLARVASAVKTIRAEGHPVLLLDSGDTIQGTPAQALVFGEKIGDGSDPIVRAMNAVGYDAMAIGNHEFDFGLKRLEKSRTAAKFPWLSANILRGQGEPAFPPYAIREVEGVRIGILGLTTKSVPEWEHPGNVEGLRFTDPVEAARRYVSLLRTQEHCDLVIVIAHIGFEKDPATGEDRGSSDENQAYAIATEVSGIDLLLTGHTHSDIAPRQVGKTWASQPGRFGNVLTRFDVTLEKKANRWTVGSITGRNLPMKPVAPDPEVIAAIEPEHRAAMTALAETVARLAVPVAANEARVSDTALLDWLHAFQRREGKADVSFASLLPGSLPAWPSGPLTLRQIWAFYPYENRLVTIQATGKQIRGALEVAARCVSGIAIQDGSPVWKRNPRVWGYNCDTAAGVEYAIDPMRPEGQRLLFLKHEGKPVRDDETFRVALNSYRAAGGGGYSVWKGCPRISTSESSLRDMLVEDARKKGVVDPSADENWFLAPTLPEGKFSVN